MPRKHTKKQRKKRPHRRWQGDPPHKSRTHRTPALIGQYKYKWEQMGNTQNFKTYISLETSIQIWEERFDTYYKPKVPRHEDQDQKSSKTKKFRTKKFKTKFKAKRAPKETIVFSMARGKNHEWTKPAHPRCAQARFLPYQNAASAGRR